MAKLGPVKARLLMQIADREPVEFATLEVPLTATSSRGGDVTVTTTTPLRELMADGLEDMARQLRA